MTLLSSLKALLFSTAPKPGMDSVKTPLLGEGADFAALLQAGLGQASPATGDVAAPILPDPSMMPPILSADATPERTPDVASTAERLIGAQVLAQATPLLCPAIPQQPAANEKPALETPAPPAPPAVPAIRAQKRAAPALADAESAAPVPVAAQAAPAQEIVRPQQAPDAVSAAAVQSIPSGATQHPVIVNRPAADIVAPQIDVPQRTVAVAPAAVDAVQPQAQATVATASVTVAPVPKAPSADHNVKPDVNPVIAQASIGSAIARGTAQAHDAIFGPDTGTAATPKPGAAARLRETVPTLDNAVPPMGTATASPSAASSPAAAPDPKPVEQVPSPDVLVDQATQAVGAPVGPKVSIPAAPPIPYRPVDLPAAADEVATSPTGPVTDTAIADDDKAKAEGTAVPATAAPADPIALAAVVVPVPPVTSATPVPRHAAEHISIGSRAAVVPPVDRAIGGPMSSPPAPPGESQPPVDHASRPTPAPVTPMPPPASSQADPAKADAAPMAAMETPIAPTPKPAVDARPVRSPVSPDVPAIAAIDPDDIVAPLAPAPLPHQQRIPVGHAPSVPNPAQQRTSAPTPPPAPTLVAPLDPVTVLPSGVDLVPARTAKTGAPPTDVPAVATDRVATTLVVSDGPAVPAPSPRSEALSLLQLVRDHVRGRETVVAPPTHVSGNAAAAATPIDRLDISPPTDQSFIPVPPAASIATPQITVAPPPVADLSASLSTQVVDMGVSGQWIDGLARDVAGLSARGAQGRFEVNAGQLGPVQVDIRQGAEGATISLTVATQAAEQALREDSDRLRLDNAFSAVRISEVKVERASYVPESSRADSAGQQSSSQQQSSPSGWQGGQGLGQSQQGQSQQGQGRWQPRENLAFGAKAGGDGAVLNHDPRDMAAGASSRDAGRARYA